MNSFSPGLLFVIIGSVAACVALVIYYNRSRHSVGRRIVDVMPDAMIMLDRSGRIEDLNPSACSLLGTARSDAVSHNAAEFITPALGIGADVLENEYYSFSVHSKHGAGRHYVLHSTPVIHKPGADMSGRIILIRDVTQMRDTQRALDFIDKHDRATGLPNGSYMIQNLEDRLLKASPGMDVAVIMISIDTDVEGGVVFSLTDMDFLVGETAARIRGALREGGFLARTASGELCVLLDGEGMREADVLEDIHRIQSKLSKPVLLFGKKMSGSFSIGYTMKSMHGPDPQGLISKSVIAMSVARSQNPGSIMRYEEKMSEEIERKFNLAQHIGDAIANKEVFVEFQPLMSGRDDIIGAECLLRWRRPDVGLIPPDVFIPIAEEKNIIHELGMWVVEQACIQIETLMKMGINNIRLAVNVSVLQLYDSTFSSKVGTMMKRYNVPGELLELEITENMAINYDHNVYDNITAITGMGIRISMDDFGMGCTSLMYLTRLPLKTIKLDKSLARNVRTNEKFSAIVNSIVLLCSELNIELIAECVETKEQYEALANLGIDVFQGWYFSRPLSQDKFIEFAKSKKTEALSH